MAINVLQLQAKISTNAAQAASELEGFQKAAVLGAGAVAVAAIGIGVAATKMAGDFQAGMTSLVTGAGESEKNIGAVSDGILKMAVSTGTTTKQLTDGMFMIESAGFHGADGLKVLQAAAEGAKVGNADLGTTSDALTTILKDYPNTVNGASGAMNTLISTVASGKTHMQDLASSLAEILPTSSAAHVGLNDVMGAMATMTGEGVPAANAATYLRQTILALDAPGKQAKDTMASLGLSSAQVAQEMQTNLPAALKEITDAIGKKFPVGSAGYMAALKDIAGGSKQMQGILDLTGVHAKDFATNAAGVGEAAKKGGTQITGWAKVQGDFNQKVDRAREVAETLMISLGQHLLPVAGKLFDFFSDNALPILQRLTGFIGGVVDTGKGFIKFLQDSGPAATAVKVVLVVLAGAMLGLAASAVPAMVTSLVASVTAWGAEAVAAGAAAVATIAAAAPFILIGAAIAAVIAIIVLAVTHWNDITAAIGNFIKWVGNAPAPIKILVGILALPLVPIIALIAGIVLLKTHWDQVTQFMGAAFKGLGSVLSGVWGGIQAGFKQGVNAIIEPINWFISQIDKIQIHIPAIGVGPVSTPALNWNGLGIRQIPYLAEGGTITTPGAVIVGDAGPEMLQLPAGAQVTPLPTSARGALSAQGVSAQANGQPLQVNVTLNSRQLVQLLLPEVVAAIRNGTGIRST